MIRRLSYTATITAAILVLQGCVIYDPAAEFTKQRYTNTVAYFNTFYNAQRLFSDAQEEVFKAKRDQLERSVGTKVFSLPGTARTKFQTSIEKNSKVLSFYPTSKWVDDALLMIGKAYYYMEDDLRAERKFLELAVQYPNSDLIPESRLWLGKCQIRMKKFDEGVKVLSAVAADDGGDADLSAQASAELGTLAQSQERYSDAVKYFTQAAEQTSDDEMKARVLMNIGRCHTASGDLAKAQAAYEQAADASPLYSVKFQGQIQAVRTVIAQKKYDDAERTLSDMLSDMKNSEYFGQVHFELANILMLRERTEEALEKYRYIDTAFARTDEAARSYFALAQYYETHELRYDSARTLYQKARMEFGSSEINKIAGEKSDQYAKYDQLWKELTHFDSLRTVAINNRVQRDSLAAAGSKDTVARIDTVVVKEEKKPAAMTKPGKKKEVEPPAPVIDSSKVKEKLTREQAEAKWIDSLSTSIVRTNFELGSLFFLEIQQPDSAVRWFRSVVALAPSSEFAPRSLYSMAEIARTVPNGPAGETTPLLRKIISDYPESPYANEARRILGEPVVVHGKDSVLTMYEKAESALESGALESGAQQMKRIADQFPKHALAAKALYSAAWFYESTGKNNDSAAAVYRRLIARFPLSSYIAPARTKVTELENELKRIEEEKKQAEEEKKRAEEERKQKEKEAQQEKEVKPSAPSTPDHAAPSDSLSTPKKAP